jgi:TonB-linked SusC/RagA family outer membrane protein
MKTKLPLTVIFCLLYSIIYSQTPIRGRVIHSEEKTPLTGVQIFTKSKFTQTDANGNFQFNTTQPVDTLHFSMVGFEPQTLYWNAHSKPPIEIELLPKDNVLNEVIVSTGYSTMSRSQSTGSFSVVNTETLERAIASDLLSKLEGITPSLQFNAARVTPHGNSADLRVRGLSTIYSSTRPLIVWDGFPYEGDISHINPNDIESITVLKDASAASIWGVRAGNGVIVINSKKGRKSDKTNISFQSNFTIADKPDLNYDKTYLGSADQIEYQAKRFAMGGIQQNNWTLLPSAIEIMIQSQNGQISENESSELLQLLAKNDNREQIKKYLYSQNIKIQNHLLVSGATEKLQHSTSFGFDQNTSSHRGFSSNRFTLNQNIRYQLTKKLAFNTSINWTSQKLLNNGLLINDLQPRDGGSIQPYDLLISEQGEELAIPYRYRQTYVNNAEKIGFQNWTFTPLQELSLKDKTSKSNYIRINFNAEYEIFPGLEMLLKYQFGQNQEISREYIDSKSYYVRDLVNRFTQLDGTKPVPLGGILSGSATTLQNHYTRAQLNYRKNWTPVHKLQLLAGMERRQDVNKTGPGYKLYGYNPNNLTSASFINYSNSYTQNPNASGRIPGPSNDIWHSIDRYLSYFSNFGYTFQNRYTASFTTRWDASNLFGVTTNQKGVPLWSAGLLWDTKETLFAENKLIGSLKFRISHGANGNINKQISTIPNLYHGSGTTVNYPYAQILSLGNPELRWEKVMTSNVGVETSLLNQRLQLNFDYYIKNGKDLIGYDFIDPTTGIFMVQMGRYNIDNRINFANLRTKGLDIELQYLLSNHKLKWSVKLMSSFTKNKVIKYKGTEAPALLAYFPGSNAGRTPPTEGKSLDMLYSIPWNGLDPGTGSLLVKLPGQDPSQNYAGYWSSLRPENLTNEGSSVPTQFGSILNTLSLNDFTVSTNISYKAGYVFRRTTVNYSNMVNMGSGHQDYLKRWQSPGDELVTTIPSIYLTANATRENIFMNSSPFVENGAHIRIRDISFKYNILKNKGGFRSINLSAYVNNLGILWRANSSKIDPDYPTSDYLPVRSYALGLNLNF